MLLYQPLLVWIQPALPKLDFRSPLQRWTWSAWCWFSITSLPSVRNFHRSPQNESEWAQIKIIWSVQQWIEHPEKLIHQAWLPGWVLQRGARYIALSAHLGSCHTPSVSCLSLPTSRITTDWEKQRLMHLAELISPGDTKRDFAFVPQFPVCKTRNNDSTSHHWGVQWMDMLKLQGLRLI